MMMDDSIGGAKMDEYITFAEVKAAIAEHLRTALEVEKFDITYAELLPEENEWRVNAEYVKAEVGFHSTVAIKIDAKTGEILILWKDRAWNPLSEG